MPKKTKVGDTKSKGKLDCISREKECTIKHISDAQVNNDRIIPKNAFQVMMNARNKQIGTSSPSKNLPLEEIVKNDIVEKTEGTINNDALHNIGINNTGSGVEKNKNKGENSKIKLQENYDKGKKMPYNGKRYDKSSNKSLGLKRRRPSNTEDKAEGKLKKRLINLEIEEKLICIDVFKPTNGIVRPKRNVRKPVRYTETELSSSDDEYQIFTPAKQNRKRNKIRTTDDSEINLNIENNMNSSVTSNFENSTDIKNDTEINFTHKNMCYKPTKLAPIFVSKTSTDKDVLEAKLKFLQSGVPEILKRTIEKRKEYCLSHKEFIPIRHIQQRDTLNTNTVLDPWNLKMIPSKYFRSDLSETQLKVCHWQSILNKTDILKDSDKHPISSYNSDGARVALNAIKQDYPKFPVYKVYNSLKNKGSGLNTLGYPLNREDGVIDFKQANLKSIDLFDKQLWTEKYRAINSNDIIGNFCSVNTLKKWLIARKEADLFKAKPCDSKFHDSDSSDFYVSDSDSRESMKSNNNLAIITGPTGSGKTYTVYALANELCMKVIEVNVSSKRTGKKIISDLQEATQSHKVNRQAQECNSDNTHEIQVQDKIKRTSNKMLPSSSKKTKKKKASFSSCEKIADNENETKTAMSLILIDDADIVFEQDDGFVSGLTQIIQMSKRPVVIVTSTLSCPHLLKFVPYATVIKFNPLMPKILGTWLNILSVVEIGNFLPSLGPFIINHYKGDMRKSINAMQFICCSFKNGNNDVDDLEMINEDDSSNSSWMERDAPQTNQTIIGENVVISKLMEPFLGISSQSYNNLMLEYPLNMDSVWHAYKTQKMFLDDTPAKIKLCSFVSESISLAELITHRKVTVVNHSKTETRNIFRACRFDHGISDKENWGQFDANITLGEEIAFELVQKSFATNIENSNNLDENHHSNADVVRSHDKVQENHEALAQSLFPTGTILDRKALTLDYFSGCREICRVEKTKMECSSRRSNRFYHYLKSLNSSCKNDVLSSLCESFDSNNIKGHHTS